MKKTTIYFQKMIRSNRKKLIEVGINYTTVRSWAYGYRMPDIKNAKRIAQILEMPLKEIPYREVVINQP